MPTTRPPAENRNGDVEAARGHDDQVASAQGVIERHEGAKKVSRKMGAGKGRWACHADLGLKIEQEVKTMSREIFHCCPIFATQLDR